MTDNRRIFLNIVTTYGRSLYALVIGLFCGRWALMALGQTDYGLMGLIGGLTGFVSFLNTLLASSVGRFYAVNVGAAKKVGNEESGLEDCRKWFNTALSLHTIIPLVLVLVGYPIGIWAIEHFLDIPLDRVIACVWVWRFTCIACFMSMFNVPCYAMYTAKQEIAELTIYSFATTTLNACFLYYMVTHPGIWLTKYMAWTCALSIVPQVIIGVRAFIKYDECRFVPHYLFDRGRFGEIFRFAFAKFWADFSSQFSTQGQALLVNKYMGPRFNASMSVGTVVAGQSLTLASAIEGAFWPAITNKIGEGDDVGVKRLCFTAMRLSTLMVLVFAIPLGLEIREVLRIWLVTPPPFAAEIVLILLVRAVLERMTAAYATAIYGYGKGVMKYAWTGGWAGISTVFVSWLFFAFGFGMWSIVIGLSVSKLITVGVRLFLGRTLIGFSFRYWVRYVFLPIGLLAMGASCLGSLTRLFVEPSFSRVVATSLICEVALVPMVWMLILNADEKVFLQNKICKLFHVGRTK